LSVYTILTVGNFLHRHGADINALDGAGNTPFHVLEVHAAGNRPQAQKLTVSHSEGEVKTGLAICDYALAGPGYWAQESKLSERLGEWYLSWGARRSKDLKDVVAKSIVRAVMGYDNKYI